MVSGGEGGTSSSSGSDPDLSNHLGLFDSRLHSLIDNIIENFSIDPSYKSKNMTIKNRKERLKSDRQNDRDSPGTSTNSRHNYNYKRYPYVEDRKDNPLHRVRHRVPHHDSNAAKDKEASHPLSFPSYSLAENQIYQSTGGFPLLSGSKARDILNVTCDRRPIMCDTETNEENLHSPIMDDSTGNNSEDEYYFGKHVRRNMKKQTDGDSLERLLMEKKGWKIIKVAADGACLFRSISHQIFGDEDKHDLLRSQVIDYMVKNKEHFSQYLTEDFDHYIDRKRNGSCHGNHVEIQAIAELYNRPVEIYHSSVEPINVFHADYSKEFPIRLSYHGHVHYNSVVDPFNPSFGHGLGMPNYQPGLAEPDLIVRAIHESEATHLEEAMLRDKLVETEKSEIEQCMEDQVVRDSYYEYLSRISLPVSKNVVNESSELSSLLATEKHCNPNLCLVKPSLSDASTAKFDVASSSKSSVINPGSNNYLTLSSLGKLPYASSSHQQIGTALLKHIPQNMFGMEEDALIAVVMEQSRHEYLQSLRNRQSQDKFEVTTNSLRDNSSISGFEHETNVIDTVSDKIVNTNDH